MLEVGKKAPKFSLENQEGKVLNLSSFKGKNLVVYFYPKDSTPGCTIQAVDFTKDIICWDETYNEVQPSRERRYELIIKTTHPCYYPPGFKS